ncbi:MAG: SDR family oxidoreductase [Chitinophagales bacterium]|nr:SDR family oxidoreductase [Chitinophagales bacterium]
MKILLTGATGYIGKRLLPVLIQGGNTVVCCVRDANRFNPPDSLRENIEVIEVDFLDKASTGRIPKDINAAYYLIHSMSSSQNYQKLEIECARNFKEQLSETTVDHVIYLSGIVNENALSEHLESRKAVEDELSKGSYNLTTLRAGIIIGSGSASFELIRDLVEKLPVMIAPKWLKTRCQPIGIADVIDFLSKTLFRKETYGQNFDIGGPDVLTYKEMLLGYAKVRGLKRSIFVVPVMTPRLSSYWLYFITSTSYKLATALVSSMKVEVVARNNNLADMLSIVPINYVRSLERTFSAIEENRIISSWKDSLVSGRFDINLSEFLKVPVHGCLIDSRKAMVKNEEACINRIWNIGGKTGWYFGNILWQIRGFIDKIFGGVGLRRGRSNENSISNGDAIDFWRVLYANKKEGRLLLFAEMRLPGEAWLEFRVEDQTLVQTATFRPKGVYGRLYWYLLLPVHNIIFNGMLNRIANSKSDTLPL